MPLDSNTVSKYDPINQVTNYFDKSGKFIDTRSGDTTKSDLSVVPSVGGTQPFLAHRVDSDKLMRDLISDVVPAAITMAVPEFKALGPVKNILARMGISFAGGTVADQLLNIGQDKPVLNSAVDAGANAGIAALPELIGQGIGGKFSLAPRMSNVTATAEPTISEMVSNRLGSSNSSREGTGSSSSRGGSTSRGATSGEYETNSEGLSGVPNSETRRIQAKDEKGHFLPAEDAQFPLPGFKNQSSTTGTRSGTSSQQNDYQNMADLVNKSIAEATSRGSTNSTTTTTPGVRTAVTEGPHQGPLGNVMELFRSIQHNPAAPMNRVKAASIGTILNSLFDTTINKPKQ